MGKREQQHQNKRSFEQVDNDESMVVNVKKEQAGDSNDTNNNTGVKNIGKNNNMKKQQEQVHVKHEEEEFEDAEQDEDEEEEEDEEVEEEEEIEVEEDEEEEEEEEEEDEKGQKAGSSQGANQSSQNSGSQQNSGNNATNAGSQGGMNSDKRPRLTDELYEMNLRRKKEHVGSALYIPFPRKVTEEEVRAFVGQGPNIFLVGPQKQNAIVRYRTQSECEKQQKELAKKEFEGTTLNIEPKTVKIDPANIDVKTLIVQYSNPDLSIMDFAQIFIKAISISLKGGKSKKESQEDLSFGSAIIIFPSHEEAKEAFLATENLTIKNEQLRVVFADFRPANQGARPREGGFGGGFRNKGGDNNRGNFNRNNQGGGGGNRQGGQGGGGGGGGFRHRSRGNSGGGGGGGGGGGQRNFGNRNFNQNSGGGGGGGGGGGNYNQGGGRNYSPNKKFRSNVR